MCWCFLLPQNFSFFCVFCQASLSFHLCFTKKTKSWFLKSIAHNSLHNYHKCSVCPDKHVLKGYSSALPSGSPPIFSSVAILPFSIVRVSIRSGSSCFTADGVQKTLSSSGCPLTVPLPCSLPLSYPVVSYDHPLSLLQTMWVLWFPLCTMRPLSAE